MYVDDVIIMSKSEGIILSLIKSLNEGDENFKFTDEGDIKNYLGVEFSRTADGSMEMKQEFLVDRILNAMGFEVTADRVSIVPAVKVPLSKDSKGPARKHSWHYRLVIGMLNYLEKTTRPDIAYAVHQCARFCENPRLVHERAVHRIVRYLATTRENGLKLKPDKSVGLKCYVDADFTGNCNSVEGSNPASVLSRTGYIVTYAKCPVIWSSKLQTEIALSTTEAEYIALLQALREVIPLMNMIGELRNDFEVIQDTPALHCKVFKDILNHSNYRII